MVQDGVHVRRFLLVDHDVDLGGVGEHRDQDARWQPADGIADDLLGELEPEVRHTGRPINEEDDLAIARSALTCRTRRDQYSKLFVGQNKTRPG